MSDIAYVVLREGTVRALDPTDGSSQEFLDIQTGSEPRSNSPSTNFGVVRIKRDVLRRSAIGMLFTNRSDVPSGRGSNQVVGVDAAFAFYQDLSVNTYVAKSWTEGSAGGGSASDAGWPAALVVGAGALALGALALRSRHS